MKKELTAQLLLFCRLKETESYLLIVLVRIDRTLAVEPIELVAERQGAIPLSSTFGWTLLATDNSCLAGPLHKIDATKQIQSGRTNMDATN